MAHSKILSGYDMGSDRLSMISLSVVYMVSKLSQSTFDLAGHGIHAYNPSPLEAEAGGSL